MNKSFSATLISLTRVILGLCLLASGIGMTAGHSYPAELLANFPLQYATVGALAAITFSLLRNRTGAILSVGFTLTQVVLLLPFYLNSTAASPREESEFTIMFANVFVSNGRHEAVRTLFREKRPDILVIAEFTPTWGHELSLVANEFPYTISKPQQDAFGIAVYSRVPLNQQSSPLTTHRPPSIVTAAQLAGGAVSILATHALPPMNERMFARRNEQLRALARESRAQVGPTILIGDLNTTPWSPYFRQLERDSGLMNARLSHGLNASWPAGLTPWGIPIDHLLVSSQLQVLSFESVKIPGSDHDAVLARLRVLK